jgi:hypothetical protein
MGRIVSASVSVFETFPIVKFEDGMERPMGPDMLRRIG